MLTGVILAGGQGRRMNGSVKPLLPFCGEMLIQRQVRMMKRLCREVIVVTGEPRAYLPVLGNTVRILTDSYAGVGPLGGMHAAFSLCTADRLWIVGADMPFISAEAAEAMLAEWEEYGCDAVIPHIGARHHMLHGIYHKSCLGAVTEALGRGLSDPEEMLAMISAKTVGESFFLEKGIPTHFVTSVNTGEQYHQAMQLNYHLQLNEHAVSQG